MSANRAARSLGVSAKAANGRTALLFAVKGGHINIVKLLVQKGANPNERDKEGATALDYARQSGAAQMVALLRELGARDVPPDKDTILRAQKQLNALGFNVGGGDGVLREQTAKAISEFQRRAKLTVTGELDVFTLKKLEVSYKRDRGTFLRKEELQRRYGWNGSTAVKTIDGDVTYGLTEALGMSGMAYEGHFRLGNLEVRGQVVVVSQGLIVDPDTQLKVPD